MKPIVKILLAIAAGLLLGILIGRKTVDTVVSTEYVKGDPVSGAVVMPEPVREEKPADPVLPVKTITLWRDSIEYRYLAVDTAAIIAQYEMKRYYNELLFDNNVGRLELNLTTQYNRLTALDYAFTPIQVVKTVERKRVWVPFLTASYNTLNYVSVGGGIFYHDIGLNLRYTTDFNRKGIDIGLMYKF